MCLGGRIIKREKKLLFFEKTPFVVMGFPFLNAGAMLVVEKGGKAVTRRK